ncbi:hypothetical protein [Devosia sp. RR2S18]|uniref:hypothetical protein n=1 Tax=Devosia rhizosphaerae TaxID=3049774 RepID=UPI0025422F53|nr:hypothetical protein [Devosia sp. RR2S18]WIJ24222.1 hypothetical protein QOV41_14535 [Devosia sp. RR2S18]
MTDDAPTYLSSLTWANLTNQAQHDAELCARMGFRPCPVTGRVEEYMIMDRLGGDLNIWPEWARAIIEREP